MRPVLLKGGSHDGTTINVSSELHKHGYLELYGSGSEKERYCISSMQDGSLVANIVGVKKITLHGIYGKHHEPTPVPEPPGGAYRLTTGIPGLTVGKLYRCYNRFEDEMLVINDHGYYAWVPVRFMV